LKRKDIKEQTDHGTYITEHGTDHRI